MGLFSKASGLDKLAENYPATAEPGGDGQARQTVQIGAVQYERCVTVHAGPEGLFLWVRPPLGKAAKLLIPWDEIKEVRAAKLYWRPAVRLSIGDPEVGHITVYQALLDRAQPYLPKRDP